MFKCLFLCLPRRFQNTKDYFEQLPLQKTACWVYFVLNKLYFSVFGYVVVAPPAFVYSQFWAPEAKTPGTMCWTPEAGTPGTICPLSVLSARGRNSWYHLSALRSQRHRPELLIQFDYFQFWAPEAENPGAICKLLVLGTRGRNSWYHLSTLSFGHQRPELLVHFVYSQYWAPARCLSVYVCSHLHVS